MSQLEPSSPVHRMFKTELYKIQLEAPTPKPLQRQAKVIIADQPAFYGPEYHGDVDHKKAEELLASSEDGTYLLRRSPNATTHYTMSVRFNERTKHYKIYYKQGEGHFLQEQSKHYDTINELVADGLVFYYMQLHAAPIIQGIHQQRPHCYQHSPYMTLNRRKLYAISNELRKSIVTKESRACKCLSSNDSGKGTQPELKPHKGDNKQQQQQQQTKVVDEDATKPSTEISKDSIKIIDNNTLGSDKSGDSELDSLSSYPLVYEKCHTFKVHNFKGLNWCEFCANFLWGFTAQGVKCEACGFVAHSKCSELVPPKCVPDLKRIRGVFGTDLTTMVQLHQCSIPFVVRRCVEEVEARGMLQEGIYRVSGFADEIEALKLALDRDGDKTDMSEMAYGNVNVIAGTLKLYLRLLPLPLITFQVYPSFMQAVRNTAGAEQLKSMAEAARTLPLAHYNCLKFMMEHLNRVASHYAVNKMNEQNLATVFAPTLIATPQHMTNLTEEIFMLSTLITNCETIFV